MSLVLFDQCCHLITMTVTTEEKNNGIIEAENISVCMHILIVKNYDRMISQGFLSIKIWHIRIKFCEENGMEI